MSTASDPMPPEPEGPRLLSAGQLAAEVGLAAATLRAWERRYGRPVPRRLPSGHRRYDAEQVRFVRRVVEGLARGHRLGLLMRAGDAELERLLGEPPAAAERLAPRRLLELAGQWRAREIEAALRDSYERLGPRAFIEQHVAPLFRGVGAAWAAGSAGVRHEHFVSGVVDDLLRSLRRELPEPDDGARVVVLATLEGEQHALGLQMAALVAAARAFRPLLLGASAPLLDIVAAARESGAAGVAVGVSPATAGAATDRVLSELRARLPARVRLLVGGSLARGVRRGPRGVTYLGADGLAAFESWLDGLR
jgi:DNA-binding transcriptional MerR regulator/methylmalonyl-CoA mutase cobalamin-binding subunit